MNFKCDVSPASLRPGLTGAALEDSLRRIIERKGLDLRAIAFDLDGTLLDPLHQLPQPVIAAVRRLERLPLRTVLASGRPIRSVLEMAAALNLGGPMIAANGALVADRSQVHFSYSLEPHHLTQLLALCNAVPTLSWSIYDGYLWTVAQLDEQVCAEAGILGFLPDRVCPNAPPMTAEKVLVIGPDGELARLCNELILHREALFWVSTKSSYLEIVRRGGHKALGLARFGESARLRLEHFIAVGDSENDLEMLAAAGLSVAMGNSCPAVREVADLVIGTNAECGVVQLVEALLAVLGGR